MWVDGIAGSELDFAGEEATVSPFIREISKRNGEDCLRALNLDMNRGHALN